MYHLDIESILNMVIQTSSCRSAWPACFACHVISISNGYYKCFLTRTWDTVLSWFSVLLLPSPSRSLNIFIRISGQKCCDFYLDKIILNLPQAPKFQFFISGRGEFTKLKLEFPYLIPWSRGLCLFFLRMWLGVSPKSASLIPHSDNDQRFSQWISHILWLCNTHDIVPRRMYLMYMQASSKLDFAGIQYVNRGPWIERQVITGKIQKLTHSSWER